MTTFVLVHGAWGGAHTWRHVRPALWSAGHRVFTPSLTGIGERAHLTGPHVGLAVHVDDVVNTILYEDLTDIVLVGFSYGGVVVTASVDHVGDRVRELVYLDVFVPSDGESANDAFGGGEPGPRTLGDVWLVPPGERSFDDPEEATFGEPRRTPQPVRTFTDRVSLARPIESYGFGLTYIKATGDARKASGPDPFWDAADRFRDHPAWRYLEHPSNHMVPQNDPAGLAEILRSLA